VKAGTWQVLAMLAMLAMLATLSILGGGNYRMFIGQGDKV
jgi:hypothetical protein